MSRLTGKYCWVAKQYRKGWRLGFYFHSNKPVWLPFWFASAPDIGKARKATCVYIHRHGVDGPKELDL